MSAAQVVAQRKSAAAERDAAENATLPRVRERHLRAAEAWDMMAEQAEDFERLATSNAVNKRPVEAKRAGLAD